MEHFEGPPEGETHAQPAISAEKLCLVSTGNTLAPVLIGFSSGETVRVWAVGPHPEYLNRYLFKEDYGFVSFTTFEYCEKASDLELEAVEYMDEFFGVYERRSWTVLDEAIAESAGLFQLCLAHEDNEILLCTASKEGTISKQPIRVDFEELYTDAPCIEINSASGEPHQGGLFTVK